MDKITITEEDMKRATADLFIKDGPISDLLHNVPEMSLIIPIISVQLWEMLTERDRLKTVADMLTKGGDNNGS